jgi:predicted DNA-binding protein
MKNKRLAFRLSERRYHKLLLLSVQLDRTMSSLVEDWIDSLPNPEIAHSSNISSPVDLRST